MIDTLNEFIKLTTQLIYTGKKFSIKIFRTDSKKIVRGTLEGIREEGSDVITYRIVQRGNIFEWIVPLTDIENLSQLRFMFRQILLDQEWRRIGTVTNMI